MPKRKRAAETALTGDALKALEISADKRGWSLRRTFANMLANELVISREINRGSKLLYVRLNGSMYQVEPQYGGC